MAPKSQKPITISLLYRIYFLYFEPLAALGGTYLAFFSPQRYLEGTTPLTALPANYTTISPLTQMLLTNIGSLYALFAINEGIILRLTKERNVWFAIMGAFCITDICHCEFMTCVADRSC
jgi:hypothetical protein